MALSAREQTTYWGITIAVFLAVLYVLGNVLMPFIVGAAIAYLLDPVADRLEAWGLSRGISVALISLGALLLFLVGLLLVIPPFLGQIEQLASLQQSWPELAGKIADWLRARTEGTPLESVVMDPERMSSYLQQAAAWLQARAGDVVGRVLSSARGVVSIFSFLLIVPVVAIYLLIDWDRIMAGAAGLLPRDHEQTIRGIVGDIDKTLSSFIRGQGMVCLIVGLFYVITLSLAGLNFALVVGSIAGLLSFIPFVGSILGAVMAIGLALAQFWGDWLHIVLIAAIFQAGQILEGNILTPKLVGGSIRLHPVMLLLALSAFGAIFGFVGLLVAVPVAAVMGVVIRFGIERYTESRLYRGHLGREPDVIADDAEEIEP